MIPLPTARFARRALAISLTALPGLVGCGRGDAEPAWTPLAAEPDVVSEVRAAPAAADPTLAPSSTGVRCSAAIPRDAWTEDAPGVFGTPSPLLLIGGAKEVSDLELTAGERSFASGSAPPAPGAFALQQGRLLLGVEPGEAPPELCTLATTVALRASEAPVRRTRLGAVTADGFALAPGGSVALSVPVPGDAALRFATAARQIAATPRAAASPGAAAGAPLRFRVLVDGEPVFEHEQAPASPESVAWHTVPLAAGGDDVPIRFELDGGAAVGAFLAPVLGPARPRTPDRPDLVLVLADTFRADNLATYGGEPGITPHLDALADRALVFSEARSPSTWTLPAHGSLFTGLYPGQHGAYGGSRGVPAELVTVAEHLRALGYRTGAITDSVYVSEAYGLDDGFEWFEEHEVWDVDRTLRAADRFLAAADGRPTFLFVHTYGVHGPYRVSETTAKRLGIERDYEELTRAALDDALVGLEPGDPVIWAPEMVEELRRLYLGGVVDLDLALGAWLERLRAGGALERTHVAFTSDHGEAFYEHQHLFHSGKPWGEVIRVPLFFAGPGVAPRTVAHPASLVDVPRTLADLAGVPPHPSWGGASLLSLDEDRSSYAFFHAGGAWSTAIVNGGHKLLASGDAASLGRGEYDLAFDLIADPGELDPVTTAWPAELARAQSARFAELVRPVAAAESVELSERDLERMRAAGYMGE